MIRMWLESMQCNLPPLNQSDFIPSIVNISKNNERLSLLSIIIVSCEASSSWQDAEQQLLTCNKCNQTVKSGSAAGLWSSHFNPLIIHFNIVRNLFPPLLPSSDVNKPPSDLLPSTQVKMKKRDTPLCKQQSTPCYGKGATTQTNTHAHKQGL